MAYAKICFVDIDKATGKMKRDPKIADVGFDRFFFRVGLCLLFAPFFLIPISGGWFVLWPFSLIAIVGAFDANQSHIRSLITKGYVVVATAPVEEAKAERAEIPHLCRELGFPLPLSTSFKETNAIYRKNGLDGLTRWLADHDAIDFVWEMGEFGWLTRWSGKHKELIHAHQKSWKSKKGNHKRDNKREHTRDNKREDDRPQSAKPKAKGEYDYYAILGIAKTADSATIKSAYREMAKRYHPDTVKNNKWAEARFIEIQQAYEVLSDSRKRAAYDKSLG